MSFCSRTVAAPPLHVFAPPGLGPVYKFPSLADDVMEWNAPKRCLDNQLVVWDFSVVNHWDPHTGMQAISSLAL